MEGGVAVVPAADARDWSELPLDVLCFLFGDKLVLMGAGLVCRSWLQAAKAPHVWRSVEMDDFSIIGRLFLTHDDLLALAKTAVDRSGGRLEVFAGKQFVTTELLLHIAER
ncbi:hypothetical protein BRADI_3g17232v3 [Brachypodium distachyon]|uniref:F-box domain-containing protein n=1 Tax=Brachypodium distachyon TaxID=15368 RepID=A0A0Q3HPP5_BRADI|nr:hypothetical protein BRADI_3g17232v3 [Brachypodium distachyon]